MEKYNIDYAAHDDEPYVSAGHQDVYAFLKALGLSCHSLLVRFRGASPVFRTIHTNPSYAGYLVEFDSRTDGLGLPRA
jgi:hypothetical protein